MNNGPRKGLGARDERTHVISTPGTAPYEPIGYLRMKTTPGVEDVWQGHLSMIDNNPAHNAPQNMIANLEDNNVDHQGNMISASVTRDGKFTLTNARTGFSKTYTVRK